MSDEIWRPIVGYEQYQVSIFGGVRSIKINLKTKSKRNGYPVVGLYANGVCKLYYVHRLVASAFLPNPENKKQVNHKNGNREDNKVENLEWCTSLENIRHAFRVLKRTTSNKRNSSSSKPIVQIDTATDEVINIFPSTAEACRVLNFKTRSNIHQCLSGITNTSYGFKWKYHV